MVASHRCFQAKLEACGETLANDSPRALGRAALQLVTARPTVLDDARDAPVASDR
jgi:hypothetical protein